MFLLQRFLTGEIDLVLKIIVAKSNASCLCTGYSLHIEQINILRNIHFAMNFIIRKYVFKQR